MIRMLYHGRWGEKPKVVWIDDENIEVNGEIKINIKESTMYDNKKKKKFAAKQIQSNWKQKIQIYMY